MRSFHLPVQLGRATFDVGVLNAEVFAVTMEFNLELITIIRPNFSNAKREPLNDMIDEVDGMCLRMFVIDSKGPDTSRIVDRCVLETAHLLAAFPSKCQKLDVHLDMMPRNLLLISHGVKLPHAYPSGQPIKAIAPEDAISTAIRDFDVVIARQKPDDPDRPQVILAAQIQKLVDDLGRRLVGILQASLTMLSIGITPSKKAGPANSKIPTGLAGVPNLLCVLEHPKIALYVAFFVRHENYLYPKSGNSQEVSRESVHIYRHSKGAVCITASTPHDQTNQMSQTLS